MLTQSQIAQAWGPPCRKVARPTIALHGAGKVTVDPRIVGAVKALNGCLVRWNYRTRYADTGAYVCRQKVSGTGYSNHSYGTALDINWQTNPYGRTLRTDMPAGMREAIKAIRTNNGQQVWGWGGDWRGNKDAMHWEIVCRPSDLATGIRGGTDTGTTPTPAPKPQPAPPPYTPPPLQPEDDMYLRDTKSGAIYAISATHYQHLSGPQWQDRVKEGAKSTDVPPELAFHFCKSRIRV